MDRKEGFYYTDTIQFTGIESDVNIKWRLMAYMESLFAIHKI